MRCIGSRCWWGDERNAGKSVRLFLTRPHRALTLFPSPLRGGVRGGGPAIASQAERQAPTALPNPSSQGGREREAGALLTFALLLFLGAIANAQTTFTPRDESPEDFPAGAGRDETFYACTACHNFKLVAAQGLARAGWEDSLNLMVRRHNMPPLDEKDRAVVLGYLETAFPPRAPASRPGWQNPFSKQ
jgi:hypothetical protein